MLEFDFLKRLGIEKNINMINCQKSYSFYDSNTNNLIIELYLNKDYCKCMVCGSEFIRVQKTFVSTVKTQTAEAANVLVHIHDVLIYVIIIMFIDKIILLLLMVDELLFKRILEY